MTVSAIDDDLSDTGASGVNKVYNPVVAGSDGAAVDTLDKDPPVLGFNGDRRADILSVVSVFDTDKHPSAQFGQHGFVQLLPLVRRNCRLLVIPEPEPETLDVKINLVRADLIRNGTLGKHRSEGRVCLVPGVAIVRIRLVLHAPLGPAGIFFRTGHDVGAEFGENRAAGDRRRRGAEKNRLRVWESVTTYFRALS